MPYPGALEDGSWALYRRAICEVRVYSAKFGELTVHLL
jgi:hypothetical protein